MTVVNSKVPLWSPDRNIPSGFTTFLLENDRPRPAVLVLPGGGYQMVCEPSEGAPVAKKFNSLGFHAFVLNYRVWPHTFPAPQQDALRALKIIRGRAAEWGVDPARLGVCGFSAGGHLAASLGTTMVKEIDPSDGDRFDGVPARPDFIISGQGVLSFGGAHQVTADNLLGPDTPADERMKYSPERCVSADAPPCFLWHTFGDQVVDCNFSILFAQALKEHHVPCELHIFADGDHGILLGMDTPDVSQWPQLAKTFIETHTGPVRTPRENYTHKHQCEATHTYPGPWREDDPRRNALP